MSSRIFRHVVAAPAILLVSVSAFGQTPTSQPEAKHDTSPALSSIPVPPAVESGFRVRREHRVKPLPRPTTGEQRARPDAARQATAPTPFQPATLPAIPGIGSGVGGFHVQSDPPDTNGAVGRTQVVEWVNTA